MESAQEANEKFRKNLIVSSSKHRIEIVRKRFCNEPIQNVYGAQMFDFSVYDFENCN